MSETPPRLSDTPPLLVGEFVEVPAPNVPFGGSSDYMRMLREAQGETSCRTSCGVSPYLSHNLSPKSPPNSPSLEQTEESDLDLTDVYINRDVFMSDFIWDWSSRPNIVPPKQWKLQNKCPAAASSEKKSPRKISSNLVLTFFLTNVISLIIGAGIGIWLKRKVFKSALWTANTRVNWTRLIL